jgi:hypothetical protein
MRRKVKAALAAIPSILTLLLVYAILNWDDLLEGATFFAEWLGTTQGQFSALIVIVGTVSNLYGKFRQTNLPKTLGSLFGWKKALRNLSFLNELLNRFTFEEVMTLLRNVDVLQQDMKEAVHDITVLLAIEEKVKPAVPSKKTKPHRTRNELAFAVAEQLRLLGKKVEVAVIEEKMKLPFHKPAEHAQAREQDRIRRLHTVLKNSQKQLATLFEVKEPESEPE